MVDFPLGSELDLDLFPEASSLRVGEKSVQSTDNAKTHFILPSINDPRFDAASEAMGHARSAEELQTFLSDSWEPLEQSHTGFVCEQMLEHPEMPLVAKVTPTTDKGYCTYAQFAQDNPAKSSYYPQVFGYVQDAEKAIVIMEKLEPVRIREALLEFFLLRNLSRPSKHIGGAIKKMMANAVFPFLPMPKTQKQAFKTCCDDLAKIRTQLNGQAYRDILPGNVMRRPDTKEIVVTDPLSPSSKRPLNWFTLLF
jgi:hypothetical protein